jgi:hypothetical protein
MVQLQDAVMDCPAVLAEMQAGALKISDLAGEQGLRAFKDASGRLSGYFAGWRGFGTDWQETVDKEARALQLRHQYLMILAEKKRCAPPAQR